ncbi:MAG: HAD hydrolase family protein [Candidatus Neomarinimicrobiota bacterium]
MISINEKLSSLKMIISDVDGVLTDGSVYKGTGGAEFKRFSINDGTGFALARSAGYKIALISGRFSESTLIRADELKITDVYNGTLNKVKPLNELRIKYGLENKEIAYLGDDLIDLPIMELVGVPMAVANASDIVKEAAVYTTEKAGGEGAFTDCIEWILKSLGLYDSIVKNLKDQINKSA